jgi:drug/metabolite transporter (DMT)-like permease
MVSRAKGIRAAVASAVFLGFLPVFGKQAILLGMPPLVVVALRTLLAAGLLLLVVTTFQRPYLYIYPAGFYGCLIAGGLNGFGSLLFYAALGRIDAGLGQLLYSLYPLFAIFWFRLDQQPSSRLTWIRLLLAIPAIYLLVQTEQNRMDMVGVVMMLGAALLYALHLPINQRVLYDMPPPTVTLYTLLAMSAVVVPALLVSAPLPSLPTRIDEIANMPAQAWWAIFGLTMFTFFSRLTLFSGVKHLGGVQTALLGLGELVITVISAQLWLGERLTALQWCGAFLLIVSLSLIVVDKPTSPHRSSRGWLGWLHPPTLSENLSRHSRD